MRQSDESSHITRSTISIVNRKNIYVYKEEKKKCKLFSLATVLYVFVLARSMKI